MPKGPGGVFLCTAVAVTSPDTPPPPSRAAVFIDGQNLYRSVKDAFGYPYPNYDVMAIARKACELAGGCFLSIQPRFYTGIPDNADDPMWHAFWSKKLLAISRQGVTVIRRSLRYRNEKVRVSDGVTIERRIGREKGIDVRIALDLVSMALEGSYDVAIIMSQDQDLSEAAKDVKTITSQRKPPLRLVSAYPWRDGHYANMNDKGINGTDWVKIDRASYDACLDPYDYRDPSAKRTR